MTDIKTKVINKKVTKNYDAVYIGRGSPFGNPFVIGVHGTRDEVIDSYKTYFLKKMHSDFDFRDKVLLLRGRTLACFCKPLRCHGDVIKEYLDLI